MRRIQRTCAWLECGGYLVGRRRPTDSSLESFFCFFFRRTSLGISKMERWRPCVLPGCLQSNLTHPFTVGARELPLFSWINIYIYTMNMICVFGCTHDSFGHYWCSTCIRSSLTSRHDDKRLVAQSDDANKTDVADPKEPSVGTSDNGCYRRKRFLFGSCPGSYVARDSKRRPHP